MESLVPFGFNSKGDLKVFRQTWPGRATPVTLWRTGLLLGLLSVCACLEEDCVLGVVGQSVLLPCLYPGLSTLKNVSIEWRREDEVVLTSTWWEEEGHVEDGRKNGATVASDALLTGNLSLELPTVDPIENQVHYSLVVVAEGNRSAELCAVCLRSAASFSSPLLHRQEEGEYTCHSSGGFPQPAVSWVINDDQEPPEGSVRTRVAPNPRSRLYNITSHLTLHDSNVSSVSCIVENQLMNETLTSTSYDVRVNPVKEKKPSEVLWIFSLALCVAVGAMVMAAVVYQIHLDRTSKKKKEEYENSKRGHKRQVPNQVETEVMMEIDDKSS